MSDTEMAGWQASIHNLMKRRRVAFSTEGPSRTKPSFAAATDANAIVRKYLTHGEIPEYRAGTYGDFSNGKDYHETMSQIAETQQAFDALPSGIRSRFDNDPGKLLDALVDPDQAETLVELGLLEAPETPPEPASEPAPEPEPEPPTS